MARLHDLPQLSQVDFFRFKKDELVLALANAIDEYRKRYPKAVLTDHQAAILAWAAASIDVPNGGFIQFFFNHGGNEGVQELAELLDGLDQSKAAKIFLDADDVYQQHREQFKVDNPWDGLFGSIDEFDKLDRSLMKHIDRCNRAVGDWIGEHISELASDDSGKAIDSTFTGTAISHYPNGQTKESLEIKKGVAHGMYCEYFENGSIRERMLYKSGKFIGDCWPNGQLKRKESKQGKHRVIEWFYSSGAIKKRYVKDKHGYAAKPIQLFHENGQLAEELTLVKGKKRGPWLKFFDDGKPELQAEYVRNEKLVVANAWDEDRKQVVKNGNGVFRDFSDSITVEFTDLFENHWPSVSELKKGVPHGKVTSYSHGVLSDVTHYAHGKPDGDSTTYWDNGRVRSVTKFAKGKSGKRKEFPKFDHPIPAVILTTEADGKLYDAWRHIPVDEYPRPLNLEEIQRQLSVPEFLRDVHQRNLDGALAEEYEDCNTFNDGIAYFLTVDPSGEVKAVKANGSGVYSSGYWDTYVPLLQQLHFTPGRVKGEAVQCQVVASVEHTFVEQAK